MKFSHLGPGLSIFLDSDQRVQEILTIEVWRSVPGKDRERPSFSKYEIPLSNQMTVLAALQYAREHIDSSLVFNYSCEKQRCGSCAMKIDGKISLACFTPARNGQKISPLPGFKVARDLVVDWTGYENKMRQLLPVLSSTTVPSARDKVDRATEMNGAPSSFLPVLEKSSDRAEQLSESASTCIRCYSCVGACPTVDISTPVGFAGPAISVMLASHIDQKGTSKDYVSSIMNANLEYCTRCYACNAVCPEGINIVGCIQELQKISGSSDPNAKRLNEMMAGYF